MREDRLMVLADFLDGLPKKNFNFNFWGRQDRKNYCGTVACALGWAQLIPAFNKQGLCPVNANTDYLSWCTLDGQSAYIENAAASFFELTDGEVTKLFVDGAGDPTDKTPKDISKRIRTFIRNNL